MAQESRGRRAGALAADVGRQLPTAAKGLPPASVALGPPANAAVMSAAAQRFIVSQVEATARMPPPDAAPQTQPPRGVSEAALEYYREGLIDEHTWLVNPNEVFIDPGRPRKHGDRMLTLQEYLQMPVEGTREIIVVAPDKDPKLRMFLEDIRMRVKKLAYKEKVIEISLQVAKRCGGDKVTMPDLHAHVRHLKSQNRSNVVLLGQIEVGLCRHRALLFKYCCDELGISCRVVRGQYRSRSTGWHVWNVIVYRCQPQVVDCMHEPGVIYEGKDARVEMCYKRGHNDLFGAGLMSIR